MKLKDRLAGIDANLHDVQAGAEACARAADTLIADRSRLDGHLEGPLAQALTKHLKDLQACTRDQRTALRELRDALALLRDELMMRKPAGVRPPERRGADADKT